MLDEARHRAPDSDEAAEVGEAESAYENRPPAKEKKSRWSASL